VICWDVFSTHEERNEHLKARSCEGRSPGPKGGVYDEDVEKIEELSRVKRRITVSEEPQPGFAAWYAIWKELFPDTTEPSDPCKLAIISGNYFRVNNNTLFSRLWRRAPANSYDTAI
jgi:hypothetical protein